MSQIMIPGLLSFLHPRLRATAIENTKKVINFFILFFCWLQNVKKKKLRDIKDEDHFVANPTLSNKSKMRKSSAYNTPSSKSCSELLIDSQKQLQIEFEMFAEKRLQMWYALFSMQEILSGVSAKLTVSHLTSV